MIERLSTQRACIEWALGEVAQLPGPVLEIGLGKGRTYDHMRRLASQRAIFCFDREVHAPRDCVPSAPHLILGDFRETLPTAMERIGHSAIMVHADVGSENQQRDARLAGQLAPLIFDLLAPGGLVLTDRAMDRAPWSPRELPDGVGNWEYFIYQR
jgi:hypothetical protein